MLHLPWKIHNLMAVLLKRRRSKKLWRASLRSNNRRHPRSLNHLSNHLSGKVSSSPLTQKKWWRWFQRKCVKRVRRLTSSLNLQMVVLKLLRTTISKSARDSRSVECATLIKDQVHQSLMSLITTTLPYQSTTRKKSHLKLCWIDRLQERSVGISMRRWKLKTICHLLSKTTSSKSSRWAWMAVTRL